MKKLHRVVTKIYGSLPVIPIRPEIILSTDDTVNYIFEVKGSNNVRFRELLQKKTQMQAHNKSIKIRTQRTCVG